MKNLDFARKAILWLIVILTVVLCAGLIAGGVFLYLQGSAAGETVFSREAAAGMLRLFLVPALLLAALLVAAAILGVKGAERTPVPRPCDEPAGIRTKEGSRLAWALLAAAAVLITAGALNGGLRDVLAKAVSICTECIGLG